MELLIARNPDPDSTLAYLLRLPVGDGLVFRTEDTWPRTSALYCHPVPASEWPDQPDIVEQVPLRACARRGAAIHVVADRSREHRSQVVFTVARGREMVFWQSPAVPIVFCETRRLAEEWTYRYLAAAHSWAGDELSAVARMGTGEVATAGDLPAPAPSTAEVRAWARTSGLTVPQRGRLRPEVHQAWRDAHRR